MLIQDPVFIAKNEIKDLTDNCGNIINISEHATMMVPFFCLPILVLMVLLVKKPFIKASRSVAV